MAIYYFRNSGDVNWGLSTNWSTTDGGPGDGAVPTSSDDAYFTANSGNCTVNATTRQCKDLIFTGYTNTITVSNILEIYGASLTLGAGMGMAGTSSFKIRPSSGSTITVTSNARAFDVDLILETTGLTVVLADDMVLNQSFSQNSGSTITINGADLYLNENVSFASSSFLNGTCDIIYSGTGLLSTAAGQFVSIGADFNINTAGTLTLSETIFFTTAPTYTAGTVVNNGTINFTASGGSMTIPTDFEYNNVGFGTGTYTLATNDLIVNGDLTYLNNSTIIINGTDVYIGGDLFLFPSTTASGTSDFILDGTGTWSQGSGSGYLRNNLTINTAGTITVSGIVKYGAGTITYVTGTVVTTGSTLLLGSATSETTTVNTNGIIWNTVTVGLLCTINFTSNFRCSGTFTMPDTQTINGSSVTVGGSWFSSSASGTSSVILDGSGTITMLAAFNGSSNAGFTINTLGTYSISQAPVVSSATGLFFSGRSFYYVAGTISNQGGFDFQTGVTGGGTIELDMNGLLPRNFVHASNNGTCTLLSDVHCTNLRLGEQGFSQTTNGYTIYCHGDLTLTDTIGSEAGTTNIVLDGRDRGGSVVINFTQQSAAIGGFKHNTYIDTPGTITFRGPRFNLNTGTFAILRGTVVHVGTNELYVSANTRFIGFDRTAFKTVVVTSGVTIEMDRFFGGNNVANPTSVSASGTTQYNVTITDAYSIVHGAQVSRCNVTTPGKLRLTHAFANRGNNTGVLFGQETYGAHENARTVFTRPEFLQETIDFMTAAGVTNNMTVYNSGVTAIAGIKMWEYLDAHVRNMMGIGPLNQTTNFWTKYVALYPFIGGTAASHKYNLKNPLDTDAAYRITFSGTITHNGFGATGVGGGLAWGNTHLIPDTVLSLNDTSIFRYTNSAGSDAYDMGIFRPGYHLYMRLSQVGNSLDNGVNSSGFSIVTQSSTPVAMAIHSRKSASEWKAYYSRNSPITVSSAAGTLAYEEFPIMALRNVGSINNHSLANFSYAGIGGGVTDDEATLLTTIVHDFQKKLNRALYEI